MSPVIAQRFHHAAFPGGVDVWPKLHDGVLNYGLDVAHYNAQWDGGDPYAGFFPTTESVAARTAKGSPRDGLGNLRKGMTTHVKVITLTPGKQIFRFGQNTEATAQSPGSSALNVPDALSGTQSWAPFCGPWWTSSLGFENMLGRVSATYESSAIGVLGGKALGLREYARRYSAVFTDWSRMEIVGACRVLRPIRCFMGMGAKLERSNVPVSYGGIQLLESESYQDANVQLYLPNLWGQIGTYLSPPQVWSPEKVDELLSRRVQQMRKQGTMLYERKRFIFEQLMGG